MYFLSHSAEPQTNYYNYTWHILFSSKWCSVNKAYHLIFLFMLSFPAFFCSIFRQSYLFHCSQGFPSVLTQEDTSRNLTPQLAVCREAWLCQVLKYIPHIVLLTAFASDETVNYFTDCGMYWAYLVQHMEKTVTPFASSPHFTAVCNCQTHTLSSPLSWNT